MDALRRNIDRITGLPMFAAALAFLWMLGMFMHAGRGSPAELAAAHYGRVMVWLYPLFIAEFLLHLLIGSKRRRQYLLFCLVPPLRLAARDCETGKSIWLPSAGWTEVDASLVKRVEKAFGGPMIAIALLMLPLLALEFIWRDAVKANAFLALLVDVGTALIWTAFAFEFIVMVSIVGRRIRYCREHWIDLVIIIAPMLAFARLLRLGRLMRLQYLLRASRLYRLRGLALRMYRAVMLLEVLARFVQGSPGRRLKRLRETLAEKKEEIEQILHEIREIEAKHGLDKVEVESSDAESKSNGQTVGEAAGTGQE